MIINKGQEYNLPILFSQCICDEEISSMTIYLYTNSPDGCVEYALGSGVSLTSKTTAIVHVEPGDLDGLPDGLLSYACDYNDIIHEGQTTYVLNTPGNYQPLPSPEESYESGYTSGYSVGFEEGYESGTTDGYESGYTSGYADGYESGSTGGGQSYYQSGYTSGYTDGYESGYTVGTRTADNYKTMQELLRWCLVFERVSDYYPGDFYIAFRYNNTIPVMENDITLSYSYDGAQWLTMPFGPRHTYVYFNPGHNQKLYIRVLNDLNSSTYQMCMPWWDCKIYIDGYDGSTFKVSGDLSALLSMRKDRGGNVIYTYMPKNSVGDVDYDFSGLFSDFGQYGAKLDAEDLRFVREPSDTYHLCGHISYANLFGSSLLRAPKYMEYFDDQREYGACNVDMKGIYTACTNIQYAYIYKDLSQMLDYMTGIYGTEITMSDILPTISGGRRPLYTMGFSQPTLPAGWEYD